MEKCRMNYQASVRTIRRTEKCRPAITAAVHPVAVTVIVIW